MELFLHSPIGVRVMDFCDELVDKSFVENIKEGTNVNCNILQYSAL